MPPALPAPATSRGSLRQRQRPAPRRRPARWPVTVSPELDRLIEGAHEAVGALKTDHPQPLDLAALAIEEHDAGGAEQPKALEQRGVVRAIGGDIRLQQEHVPEARLHPLVAEGVALHLLARD